LPSNAIPSHPPTPSTTSQRCHSTLEPRRPPPFRAAPPCCLPTLGPTLFTLLSLPHPRTSQRCPLTLDLPSSSPCHSGLHVALHHSGPHRSAGSSLLLSRFSRPSPHFGSSTWHSSLTSPTAPVLQPPWLPLCVPIPPTPSGLSFQTTCSLFSLVTPPILLAYHPQLSLLYSCVLSLAHRTPPQKLAELGLSRTVASTEVSVRNVCLSLPVLLSHVPDYFLPLTLPYVNLFTTPGSRS